MNSKRRVPMRFPHDIKERIKKGLPIPKSVYTGTYRQNPYKQVWFKGRSQGEHRVNWQKSRGVLPAGTILHHRDSNKSNARLSNLAPMKHNDHAKISGAERPVDYSGKSEI